MPKATWLANLVSWQALAGFSGGDIASGKKGGGPSQKIPDVK